MPFYHHAYLGENDIIRGLSTAEKVDNFAVMKLDMHVNNLSPYIKPGIFADVGVNYNTSMNMNNNPNRNIFILKNENIWPIATRGLSLR